MLTVVRASSDGSVAAAFAALSQQQIGALQVGTDSFFYMQRDQLVALAKRHAMPTMYFFREFVAAGGLISFGTMLSEGFRLLGVYTGRILRGASPSDLPIAQLSEKIELVVNLKTAKTLSLTIPPSILARADEVIE